MAIRLYLIAISYLLLMYTSSIEKL